MKILLVVEATKKEKLMTSQFHLHVNHFGKKMPMNLELLWRTNNFTPSMNLLRGPRESTELQIYTLKFTSRKEAEEMFDIALMYLEHEKEMNGYVECEEVTEESVVRFTELTERPYEARKRFPLHRPEFVKAERGADIHIFRSRERSHIGDTLDQRLTAAGFYEVWTTRERIWTLLLENPDDAEIAFQKLRAHFEKAGGITKIEKEVIYRLETVPNAFSLMKVAQSNSFLRRR
jgi:hypothetical protein